MQTNITPVTSLKKAQEYLTRIRNYAESPDSPIHESWIECNVDGAAGVQYTTRNMERALEVAKAARICRFSTSSVLRRCQTFIDASTYHSLGEIRQRVWVVYFQGILTR